MRKYLIFLLTITLLLSLAACGEPAATEPEKDSLNSTNPDTPDATDPIAEPDDGMETIYLLTARTEYMADGTKGYNKVTYSYDDRGNLLTETHYWHTGYEYYDEENNYYVTVREPYDDIADYFYEYGYNENGHITHYAKGSSDSLKGYNYDPIYHYGEDGRIESVDFHHVDPTGEPDYDKPVYTYDYHYNDAGLLVEVSSLLDTDNTDLPRLWATFDYNEAGQLTEEIYYKLEGRYFFRYEYNNDGLLTKASSGSASSIDEYGRNLYDTDDPFNVWGYAVYLYDEAGRLTAKENHNCLSDVDGDHEMDRVDEITGTVTCEYDNDGNLTAIKDGESSTFFSIVDGKKVVTRGSDTFYHDENGNLIRYVDQYGNYTEYTYQAIRVSHADAKRFRQLQIAKERSRSESYNYETYYEFLSLIPYPTTILNEAELLLAQAGH